MEEEFPPPADLGTLRHWLVMWQPPTLPFAATPGRLGDPNPSEVILYPARWRDAMLVYLRTLRGYALEQACCEVRRARSEVEGR